MILPGNQKKKVGPLFFIGLALMTVAGIGRLFLSRGAHTDAAFGDGMIGFIFGLAIGVLLVGLVRQSRGARNC